MSTSDRRGLLNPSHESLSVRRQCELVGVARLSFHRAKPPAGDADLALMKRLDQLFTERPFYGSRRMTPQLRQEATRKRLPHHAPWMGSPSRDGSGHFPRIIAGRPGPELRELPPYRLAGLQALRRARVERSADVGPAEIDAAADRSSDRAQERGTAEARLFGRHAAQVGDVLEERREHVVIFREDHRTRGLAADVPAHLAYALDASYLKGAGPRRGCGGWSGTASSSAAP